MITWIQKAFQHHFRIIFGVLLVGTIVSFIMTIGAAPGLGGGQRKTRSRPFFGLNLSSEEDGRRLMNDAQTSIVIQAGYMPYDQSRLEQYAFTRYASLSLADQLGIPAPTQSEIADYIKTLPRFFGESGQFDPKKYQEYRDSLSHDNTGTTEADISRVLGDNLRASRVQKLLGGPGYVLPAEVKKQMAIIDTTWTLDIATVDYTSYHPQIAPTEAELTKFFTENGFRYTIQPKVELSYVEFAAANYLNRVNVTEADVRAFYDTNPARFPKPSTPLDPKTPNLPTPTSADYALVRPQVEAAAKLERAQKLASKEASDFAVALFEHKIAANSPEFNQFLAQQHLTLKNLPPFAKGEHPAELGQNPDIEEQAFQLNAERYFSDAISTGSGSVVLFWKGESAERQPVLAEVRAKVATDYVEEERRKRFIELGKTLRSQILARVKTGEAFEKVADAIGTANGVKIQTKNHPSFSLRQQPKDIEPSVFNLLQHLEKGEVSDLVRTENEGLIVYAADKKLPDVSETAPAFVQTRTQIAMATASRNSSEYLGDLVQSELAKTPEEKP